MARRRWSHGERRRNFRSWNPHDSNDAPVGATSRAATAPGCADCLSMAVAREKARLTFDHSAVSDANVRMRQHHAETHTS